MKKYLCAALCIAVLLAFAGCRGTAAVDPSRPVVSMFDLSEAMNAAHASSAEMSYTSSSEKDAADKLAYVSDIDYSKVEAFFISYAKEGKGNADEIVVIALKDAADAREAEDSLTAHVESRINLYSTYDPGQVPALKKAVIFSEAQYAVLIVSENAAEVEKAFRDFIANN